jgi:hypothetical protein
LFTKASTHVVENREAMCKTIQQAVLGQSSLGSDNGPSDEISTESKQLADNIVEQITSWATKAQGHKKQV